MTALETANTFIETFFPNEIPDDEFQNLIRMDTMFPPYSEDDVKLSKIELEHAIMAQNEWMTSLQILLKMFIAQPHGTCEFV